MFTELRIGNFKGFKSNHVIPLSRITLIFGPNSSGKSAILQSLLLLEQSARMATNSSSPLTFVGREIDLGGFAAAINSHDQNLELKLGATYLTENIIQKLHAHDGNESTELDLERKWESFDLIVNGGNGHPYLREFQYDVQSDVDRRAYFIVDDISNEENRLKFSDTYPSNRTIVRSLISDETDQTTESDVEKAFDAIQTVEINRMGFLPYIQPSQSRFEGGFNPNLLLKAKSREDNQIESESLAHLWYGMIQGRHSSTARNLARIDHLGPLRMILDRVETARPGSTNDVGAAGERAIDVLLRHPERVELVNDWLQKLGVPYSVEPLRLTPSELPQVGDIQTLVLRDRRTGTIQSPKDVGVGVSQLIPLIIRCVQSTNRVLLVEQPELHLHPAVQSEIADLIIEFSDEQKGNQILVETHSEHLLLRLQRRIREGLISAADICVLYVHADNDGSHCQQLQLDENGEFIDEWPNGFFEERIREIIG